MEISGTLVKMRVEYADPVKYFAVLNDSEVCMNELLNTPIELQYTGEIHCLACGKAIKKSFAQGYCYPCLVSVPEASECILNPELCRAHLGISRDMNWSEQHCLQDHYVYLAISGGLKVGVTRSTQIPTRWIDQGAIKAIKLAKTLNRYTAGVIEVELKKHFADRTNWQRMLKNINDPQADLLTTKTNALELLPTSLFEYTVADDEILHINYPVTEYPTKVQSLDFDKEPKISGILKGIKAQYLIFDGGRVINIRKFGGYGVKLRA